MANAEHILLGPPSSTQAQEKEVQLAGVEGGHQENAPASPFLWPQLKANHTQAAPASGGVSGGWWFPQ